MNSQGAAIAAVLLKDLRTKVSIYVKNIDIKVSVKFPKFVKPYISMVYVLRK